MARKKTSRIYDPLVAEAYINNEINVNKEMTKVSIFMAIILSGIFVGYLFKLFPLNNYTLIYILMPINIAICLSPIIWSRTKFVQKTTYRDFIMILILFVMTSLNIALPKHATLGWAFAIVIANHYYSRKLTTRVYIAVLTLMLLSIYAGMFFGEFDMNLFGKSTEGVWRIPDPDTVENRYLYLHELLESGVNRYLDVFRYYFLARGAIITIIYFASLGLNVRTYNLLKNEVILKSEQQKLSTELNVAQEIQLSAIPSEFIDDDDIAMFGSMHTAKEVGGDFYNYLQKGDDIFFVIGDVSGKGVPASLFMMKANSYFETGAARYSSPLQIAKRMNAGLFKGNDSMMFLTAFIGKIDKKTGEMTFCNCGHNPPVIQGNNGDFHYLECNHGFLLGTFEDPALVEEKILLEPMGHLLLYTDGVTECKNENNELFGEAAFLEKLNSYHDASPKELGEDIYNTLMEYKGEAEQSDDITLLIFQDGAIQKNIVVFENKKESLEPMMDYVKTSLVKIGASKKDQSDFAVCADELISNVVFYSKADHVELEFLFDEESKKATLQIRDNGEEFNPLEQEDPDVTLPAEKREIGGLGIFLVKKLMEDFSYWREKELNIIMIGRKISTEEGK